MTKSYRQRIVIYLLNLGGGAGKNAVLYANILAKAEHSTYLLCGSVSEPNLRATLGLNVYFEQLDARRNYQVPMRLMRALRSIQPDLVLVTGLSNMLSAALALRLSRCRAPLVLRVDASPSGLLKGYGPAKRAFKRLAFTYSLQRADHLIALTRAMQLELETDWELPPERITLIYNGIALPKSTCSPALRGAPPTLLFVGRLSPQKDLPTLLRAFAVVRRSVDCRLVVAGDGTERKKLIALAAELHITDDVKFLGHVTNVTPLYEKAAVTVLSSRFEGFPNVLIESLSHACPIVSTRCPTGPEEIILSDDVGYLSAMGDYKDLARQIRRALSQKFQKTDLTLRAKQFSLEFMETRLLELMKKLDSNAKNIKKTPHAQFY